ncbi:BolA family protein [Thermochromatium tepidum]|jgi:transcriptional regulator, BolA protein family|uniref:BolA/IbaG family iron-sulfur metabolism protein n=1 Tax=Thermochromatium tepidum ATCC 43061 TaxID=316276 RepID=A0A6I6EAU8_THETI|nr:BolA family protein [Thermochromatium tepidum]QGU32059.1 BolA/IbaG family iron-sulfur metabolism protein [Thermochromatium tepidum ATCC 43061]
MSRKQRIESRIQEALRPLYLDVVDESYMHAVPKGSESHFKLLVVSASFEKLPLIERHRRLNALLADEFNQGLHALTMHTWTPEEWQAKGGAPASPPCLGGGRDSGL